MKKTFFLYKGLLLCDIATLIFISALCTYLVHTEVHSKAGFLQALPEIIFLSLLTTALWVLLIKRISYRIQVVGEDLYEWGVFSKRKLISIHNIQRIRKETYSFFATPMPMIQLNHYESFLKHPISPALVDYLLSVNPRIGVDPKLYDVLSKQVREKCNMQPTIVYLIGLFLWRFFSSVLFLLLSWFVILFLLALLSVL